MASGRIPMSVADLMRARLDSLEAYNKSDEPPDSLMDSITSYLAAIRNESSIDTNLSPNLGEFTQVKRAWWDNNFTLGDAIVYRPNGGVKIVPDALKVRNITPKNLFDEFGFGLIVSEEEDKK